MASHSRSAKDHVDGVARMVPHVDRSAVLGVSPVQTSLWLPEVRCLQGGWRSGRPTAWMGPLDNPPDASRLASENTCIRTRIAHGCCAGAIFTRGLLVRRLGAKPALGLPFLVIPTFYTTLASREHLVLLRASRPRLHEAGLCAAIAALPQLLLLPPSLRPLVLPLVGLPTFAAWLAETADQPGDVDPTHVWSSACSLHGGNALRCLPETGSATAALNDRPTIPAVLGKADFACPSLPSSRASTAGSALLRALGAATDEVQDAQREGASTMAGRDAPAGMVPTAGTAGTADVVDLVAPRAVAQGVEGRQTWRPSILLDRAEAKTQLSRSDYKAWKREREQMALGTAAAATETESPNAGSESALLDAVPLGRAPGEESQPLLPARLWAWVEPFVQGLRRSFSGPTVFAATIEKASEASKVAVNEAGGAEAASAEDSAWQRRGAAEGGSQSSGRGGEVFLESEAAFHAILRAQRPVGACLCWSPQEALTLLRQETSLSQVGVRGRALEELQSLAHDDSHSRFHLHAHSPTSANLSHHTSLLDRCPTGGCGAVPMRRLEARARCRP